MPKLFSLTCSTCGASLQIAGNNSQFHCEHCGNTYLLDRKVGEMDDVARKHLAPLVTYAQSQGQWLRVAEYDVNLCRVIAETIEGEQVIYVEVEYENKFSAPLKYRHDQWIVFDMDGHTFEPAKDFTHPHLYTNGKIYLGMTRVLSPGMKLKGWLAYLLPENIKFKFLQFAAGTPTKTVEFQLSE